MLVGASIRHFFNLMHTGREIRTLRWQWPTAAALMTVLIAFLSWQPKTDSVAKVEVPNVTQVVAIAQVHCASCHAQKTTDPDVEKAPGGVMLETASDLRKHSAGILKHSVLSKSMPLGNKTKMTSAERQALGAWIRAGMPDSN